MAKVYVLGSVNIDTTYYVPTLPAEGITLSADATQNAVGGKGFNQAVAAAWCGTQTALIGAVGADANGTRAKALLEARGVDTAYLCLQAAETGSAVILVNRQGDNLIVVNGGANRHVPKTSIPFAAGDYLMAQLETPPETVAYYFAAAKQRGAKTVLNLSPSQPVDARLLELTDLLLVNAHEAAALLELRVLRGEDAGRLAAALSARGIACAVITRGDAGALLFARGNVLAVSGEPVTAVDTQGAGDAFAGVLVGKLAAGADLETAVRYANRIAARCVTVRGSTERSLYALQQEEAEP